MSNETPEKNQTVGDLILAQHEVEDRLKESFKSMEPLLSSLQKIKFPTFQIPEIPQMTSSLELEAFESLDVTRERNAWERHTEMLEVQNAVLQVQKEILNDQKRNKKFMIAGLILSGLAALFGAIALAPVFMS